MNLTSTMYRFPFFVVDIPVQLAESKVWSPMQVADTK